MRYQQEIVGLLVGFLGAGPLSAAPAVEVSVRNGRTSIKASDASLPQILDAWARAGRVTLVNTTTLPDSPITLELVDVPEREALRTVLRQAGGYIAVERPPGAANASLYERIVILPAPRGERSASAAPPPAPPPTPPPPFPTSAFPEPEPDASGAVRLLDEHGQPVPDDQEGAPPPPPPPPGQVAPARPGYSSGDEPAAPPVDATPTDTSTAPAPRAAVPGMIPPIAPARR
jgi:hypothetical protein